MITRNFNLYLNAGHSVPLVINVNQYDSGEQWVFTLYNSDGTQYVPSTGAIVGIKSDGLGIINSGSVVDGKVVITETQQMTAAVGKAVFELLIDSQTHGTANFIVLVEEKPGNNADLSESDISLIQEVLDVAENIPTGGTVGQVMTMAQTGAVWADTQYVIPQMYGAKGDGVTDDTSAFNMALASGRPVLVPVGTYVLSSTLQLPFRGVLKGADRYKSILQFANGVNGVQINAFANVADLTISISGIAAGLYMYVPDNWQNNLCSLCHNITVDHRSNTMDGDGILLVAESAQNISGAYNLTFESVDVRGTIENGIHLLSNVKTTSHNETWLSDIKFDKVFIASAKTAILSDWSDISGTGAVPQTGDASRNISITFKNVSAQYRTGISERFCKIMNILYVSFTNCTPFDYYLSADANTPPYVLNATNGMCLADFGFVSEVSYNLEKWFSFENQTTFTSDFSNVIRFVSTPYQNRSYGNFIDYVTALSGTDVLTLTDSENNSINAASASTCGNMVSVTFEVRVVSLNAGNNLIGKLTISPNNPLQILAAIGASSVAGNLIRLVIDTSGNITAVPISAVSSPAAIRTTFTYVRKYYLYG